MLDNTCYINGQPVEVSNQPNPWEAVFALGNGNQWVRIPKQLREALGLREGLGISGGTIQMEHSAKYTNEFINRLNQIGV